MEQSIANVQFSKLIWYQFKLVYYKFTVLTIIPMVTTKISVTYTEKKMKSKSKGYTIKY